MGVLELPVRIARIRYEIADVLRRRGLDECEVRDRIAELRKPSDQTFESDGDSDELARARVNPTFRRDSLS